MAIENFREEHTAECSACGHVEKWSRTGDFIKRFFLPEICPNCGASMLTLAGYLDKPHWLHVIRVFRRISPKRTRNPLTWLRSERWDEIVERRYSHAAY